MKKNITVAAALDTCYRSRIRAAQYQTSVSVMAGKFLRKMAEDGDNPASEKPL